MSGVWKALFFGLAGFFALSMTQTAEAQEGGVAFTAEVVDALAMQIASPDDVTCTEGMSCATVTLAQRSFRQTYSDITVVTNNDTGYGLTVHAASPNLTYEGNIIPTGVLEETNGTVLGGQNLWSYKTDADIVTGWTAMSTTPRTIRMTDGPTPDGQTTRVTYGVSTGVNPMGTYRTMITYTATVFDSETPSSEIVTPDYMQGFTCGSIEQGETVTLIDRRDGQAYSVSRLADGLCWMSEDLRLGGDVDMAITPTYSDVTETFTLKAEPKDANGNPADWCTDDNADCVNQSLMRKTGGTGSNYAPTYLYNWYAATAGGGYDVTSGMIESSICPKGWKPPHGGTGIGSFASITSTYDTVAKLTTQPLPGFNFTGFRTGATVNFSSSGGYYWSRTAVDAGNANYLVFHSNTVKPANVGNKYYGFALRCVSTL